METILTTPATELSGKRKKLMFKDCEQVMLIADKEEYKINGLNKGRTGFIMDPHCLNGKWLVSFSGEMVQDEEGIWGSTDIECAVKEEDLKKYL